MKVLSYYLSFWTFLFELLEETVKPAQTGEVGVGGIPTHLQVIFQLVISKDLDFRSSKYKL